MLWLVLFLFLAALTLAVQFYTGVPPFPSTRGEKEAVCHFLKGEGSIYELGCGWGGLAVALAREFPERRVVGIELSPLPALVSWIRALFIANLHVRWGNFFATDLTDAGGVVCYLMMGPMPRLADKLDSELKAKTPVVAVAFHFRDRKPIQETITNGLMPGGVALYQWEKKC